MTSGERFRAPVAVHLFLQRGNDLLLLRRFNIGYQDGNCSVIAGHLDGGETVITAALREAQEEGGIDLEPAATEIVGVMHRLTGDSEQIDVFAARINWTVEHRNMEPETRKERRSIAVGTLPVNTPSSVAAATQSSREETWFSRHDWTISR